MPRYDTSPYVSYDSIMWVRGRHIKCQMAMPCHAPPVWVGDDLVRIRRLYHEQEARAEFWMQGPCKVYAYGDECGLIEL